MTKGRKSAWPVVISALLAAAIGFSLLTAHTGTKEGDSGSAQPDDSTQAPGLGVLPSEESPWEPSARALEEEAASVLEGYRAQSACALAQAGYLDLAGDVWACTVVGDGWVDMVLVRGLGRGCEKKTVRFSVEEWRDSYEMEVAR